MCYNINIEEVLNFKHRKEYNMDFNLIVLLGKDKDGNYIFGIMNEGLNDFTIVGSKTILISKEQLKRDIMKNIPYEEFLELAEDGIITDDIFRETDTGDDLLPLFYNDFLCYFTKTINEFELIVKTDIIPEFAEFFNKERFDELKLAKENKDKSTFKKIYSNNDLFNDFDDYKKNLFVTKVEEIYNQEPPKDNNFIIELKELLKKYNILLKD